MVLATWVVLIIYVVRQHRRTRHNAGHARAADSFHIYAKSHEARSERNKSRFMDKLGYTLYSTRPSRQRGLESCSEVLCDVIHIGRVLGTQLCASSHKIGKIAIWQNYQTIAKHFADNISRLPFDGLHNILTIFSVLCEFGDAFGKVCEFSLALFCPNPQHSAKPTSICNAASELWRSSRNDTAGHTAAESCATGVRRDVVLTSYSKVKIVNHDRFYKSLINNMDDRLTGALISDNCLMKVIWLTQTSRHRR